MNLNRLRLLIRSLKGIIKVFEDELEDKLLKEVNNKDFNQENVKETE